MPAYLGGFGKNAVKRVFVCFHELKISDQNIITGIARLLRHLVCTVVVTGLDNFSVLAYNYSYLAGKGFDISDRFAPRCGDEHASNSVEVTVTCTTPLRGQFVVILTVVNKRLCLPEVAIFGTGQYSVRFTYLISQIV